MPTDEETPLLPLLDTAVLRLSSIARNRICGHCASICLHFALAPQR